MNKEQKTFHKSRREILRKALGKDAVAVVFGSTVFNKSYDGDFRFKQFKNFYYLTGFEEPNSAIMISNSDIGNSKSKEVLFVQRKDLLLETWTGHRMGFERVSQELGIKKAFVNTELPAYLNFHNIKNLRRIYLNIAELIKLTGEMRQIVTPFLESLNRLASHVEIVDISYLLGKMRAVKSGYEIKMIRTAADISVKSYYETLKTITPGKHEYEIQASLEYNYKIFGSEDNAYYPIVASGENGCILHYENNNCLLKNGEMLLIDSAGEHKYYCSDITRTFPINGKFTKEQRQIYEIVLKANKESIKRCRPGVSFEKLKAVSDNIIADGLHKMGILKSKKDVKKFTLHGLGHHIGLDTHDAVSYAKTTYDDNDKLRPGNVVTIEPGIYIPSGSQGVPKKYWGMAVRIEDDVLVTKKGPENLTSHMIKEVNDIEAFMNSAV
jgi:Xaa-Pro aminopeptidase